MDNNDAESGAASVDLSMKQDDMVGGFVGDVVQHCHHVALALCCPKFPLRCITFFCLDRSDGPSFPILLFHSSILFPKYQRTLL